MRRECGNSPRRSLKGNHQLDGFWQGHSISPSHDVLCGERGSAAPQFQPRRWPTPGQEHLEALMAGLSINFCAHDSEDAGRSIGNMSPQISLRKRRLALNINPPFKCGRWSSEPASSCPVGWALHRFKTNAGRELRTALAGSSEETSWYSVRTYWVPAVSSSPKL